MSSKIKLQRICEYCGNEFIAKTTVTRYCSHKCNQRHYKERKKSEKIELAKTKIVKQKFRSIEEVKIKEFLSVRDVSILLGCSLRSTYRLIGEGKLKSVNLSQRMIRVKRSEVNKLME